MHGICKTLFCVWLLIALQPGEKAGIHLNTFATIEECQDRMAKLGVLLPMIPQLNTIAVKCVSDKDVKMYVKLYPFTE